MSLPVDRRSLYGDQEHTHPDPCSNVSIKPRSAYEDASVVGCGPGRILTSDVGRCRLPTDVRSRRHQGRSGDDGPGARCRSRHLGDQGTGRLSGTRGHRIRIRPRPAPLSAGRPGRGHPRRATGLGRRRWTRRAGGGGRARGGGGPRQPGRDRSGLGPGDRGTTDRRDRLAGPARRTALHRTGPARSLLAGDDRSAARPVLRRPQDGLDTPPPDPARRRDDQRRLARAPPHRRVRHRRGDRRPHPAARPRHHPLVGRGTRRLRPHG